MLMLEILLRTSRLCCQKSIDTDLCTLVTSDTEMKINLKKVITGGKQRICAEENEWEDGGDSTSRGVHTWREELCFAQVQRAAMRPAGEEKPWLGGVGWQSRESKEAR